MSGMAAESGMVHETRDQSMTITMFKFALAVGFGVALARADFSFAQLADNAQVAAQTLIAKAKVAAAAIESNLAPEEAPETPQASPGAEPIGPAGSAPNVAPRFVPAQCPQRHFCIN